MKWDQVKQIEGGVKIPGSWVYLIYYEAFNLLFRIENALRIFVYIVLKNELRDKWADAQLLADDEQGTLASLAKRRMSQAQTFGYLGYKIACPVMHLNSGELTRLIVSDAYWKFFKPYFMGSKEIIKSKLDEIGSIRNSLAHFRPIRADDVDVVKQNSKHVLLGIEKFLGQVLMQGDVVPTNAPDEWYRNLKTLGTDQCAFRFMQSSDEQWIRLMMRYSCPVIEKEVRTSQHVRFTVLTLRSSAILSNYPEIASDVCSLSESITYPRMLENKDGSFSKIVSFVLSRAMLASQHANLKGVLESLLLDIAKETELIQQDNLARGKLLHSASVTASANRQTERRSWRWGYKGLHTPVVENDAPEYWGAFTFWDWEDFIAGAEKYPWMPESVSEGDIPF